MVNPNKKVEVDFLGEPRTLYFNILRLAELERLLGGRSVLACIQNQEYLTSVNFLVKAYWVGLKHEEPGLTENRVANMIGAYLESGEENSSLSKLMLTVFEAIQKSGLLGKVKILFPAEDGEGASETAEGDGEGKPPTGRKK